MSIKKFSEYQELSEKYKSSFFSSFAAKKEAQKMANALVREVKRIDPPDPDAHAYSPLTGGQPKLYEKDEKFLQDVESTGEWTDYTIAELEKKKAVLMKKKKRTADEVKTVRQLNFAINAKQGDYK